MRYQLKDIDKTSKCYNATSISNNHLYLAYGGSDNIIKVYSLKEDRILKQI